jgi:AbrB family looped-hinge helix DNA binding protein
MKATIDRAGRVVVPKPLRDRLGLQPNTPLDIEVVDGHLEISARREQARVIDGPDGPVVAATGTTITDEAVRAVLEAAREHR